MIETNVGSVEALMTVDQVARMLQVSKGWVHDHANGRRRPVLRRVKLGKSVRFRQSDVNAFVDECSKISER